MDNGRKIYRSANGTPVELDKLIMRNETTVAVGNVRVNARGDELGPGGKIVKRSDDITFQNNPTSETVVEQPRKQRVAEPMEEVVVPVKQTVAPKPVKIQKQEDAPGE
jgi:hypothetical protein